MKVEVKYCPCCGRELKHRIDDGMPWEEQGVRVDCPTCDFHARGPTFKAAMYYYLVFCLEEAEKE